MDNIDYALEVLLGFDGEKFVLDEKGNYIKYEARKIFDDVHRPHGVKYSLTLHDREGTRLLGYDNSHSWEESKRGKVTGRRVEWDHVHKYEKISEYNFESVEKLLDDFANSVSYLLEGGNLRWSKK